MPEIKNQPDISDFRKDDTEREELKRRIVQKSKKIKSVTDKEYLDNQRKQRKFEKKKKNKSLIDKGHLVEMKEEIKSVTDKGHIDNHKKSGEMPVEEEVKIGNVNNNAKQKKRRRAQKKNKNKSVTDRGHLESQRKFQKKKKIKRVHKKNNIKSVTDKGPNQIKSVLSDNDISLIKEKIVALEESEEQIKYALKQQLNKWEKVIYLLSFICFNHHHIYNGKNNMINNLLHIRKNDSHCKKYIDKKIKKNFKDVHWTCFGKTEIFSYQATFKEDW